jgi:hypothetical protein
VSPKSKDSEPELATVPSNFCTIEDEQEKNVRSQIISERGEE